jgi:hypothetical protein
MKDIKTLHKKLINKKIPHIITFLEGDTVTVIMAGYLEQRKAMLEAILNDKDLKEQS